MPNYYDNKLKILFNFQNGVAFYEHFHPRSSLPNRYYAYNGLVFSEIEEQSFPKATLEHIRQRVKHDFYFKFLVKDYKAILDAFDHSPLLFFFIKGDSLYFFNHRGYKVLEIQNKGYKKQKTPILAINFHSTKLFSYLKKEYVFLEIENDCFYVEIEDKNKWGTCLSMLSRNIPRNVLEFYHE